MIEPVYWTLFQAALWILWRRPEIAGLPSRIRAEMEAHQSGFRHVMRSDGVPGALAAALGADGLGAILNGQRLPPERWAGLCLRWGEREIIIESAQPSLSARAVPYDGAPGSANPLGGIPYVRASDVRRMWRANPYRGLAQRGLIEHHPAHGPEFNDPAMLTWQQKDENRTWARRHGLAEMPAQSPDYSLKTIPEPAALDEDKTRATDQGRSRRRDVEAEAVRSNNIKSVLAAARTIHPDPKKQ
ncbi:MAG: hypothetical protein FJX52_11040, partial [Alphaproteobacteria bacterium]|nr:hypothetical protein [Alphaproteobacteria bacterium]